MPGRDGTGPDGAGPMTGRGAGKCSGNNFSQFAGRDIGANFSDRVRNFFGRKSSSGGNNLNRSADRNSRQGRGRRK